MALTDVPSDIEQALRADPAAKRAFERLAPSHVREYLKWVGEAKQRATRQRRIGGMVERLRESKQRGGNGEG